MTRAEFELLAAGRVAWSADISLVLGARTVGRFTSAGAFTAATGTPFPTWSVAWIFPDVPGVVLGRRWITAARYACELVTLDGGRLALLTDYE